MDKKYHILYRVTNIETQREYIGVHSTDNVDDGYMGSGTLLKKDIKTYGVSSFNREILQFYDNRLALLRAESELVNEKYLRAANTYNLIIGGGGAKVIGTAKAIYSDKANELHISKSLYKRNDQNYQYIFDFSKVEILYPKYQMGAMRKVIMDFLCNNINRLEYDISYLWNNSYTNKIASKLISKLLQYKGFCGNLFVDIFDWDGNFIRKQLVTIE